MRLRYAYIVKCTGVTRDAAGQVTEVRCTYDPDSRGGDSKGRKVKGTIHWVSAAHAVDAEVRLYDTLFTVPKPDDAEDYASVLNPNSLEVLTGAKVEPALAGVPPETRVQFERTGYFVSDWSDHTPRPPGVQPRGRAARHLGEDREQGVRQRINRDTLSDRHEVMQFRSRGGPIYEEESSR